jgi:hypothetical protein
MQQFIKELGKYRGILPKQTIKTLRGQALSGDLEGARKGLKKVIIYESEQIQLRRICRSNGISSNG